MAFIESLLRRLLGPSPSPEEVPPDVGWHYVPGQSFLEDSEYEVRIPPAFVCVVEGVEVRVEADCVTYSTLDAADPDPDVATRKQRNGMRRIAGLITPTDVKSLQSTLKEGVI